MMSPVKRYRIVLDSSVWVSALRSNRGTSFRLLSMIDDIRFTVHLSAPLYLEYEDTARRLVDDSSLTNDAVDAILGYVCAIAYLHRIDFSWRPFLPDANDDMILELAANAQCDCIVTFNKRHFIQVDRFGIAVLTPREFLAKPGVHT
jgi:putative PIN family toxin of toxin-antitoxin system